MEDQDKVDKVNDPFCNICFYFFENNLLFSK
jgi:hypothetical protein